jgi:hypothetical protein
MEIVAWTGFADLALPLHFKKFNINPFPESITWLMYDKEKTSYCILV